MGLVTNNLAGFAAQHQRLHAQLHATLKEQGELVQRLVGAARGVAGTDWAEVLGDEIPKSKKLTRRWWPYIAAAVAAFGAFITWLVDLVRTH